MASSENKFEKANKKEGKSKKNLWITVGSVIILVLSAIAFIFIPSVGGFTSTQDGIEFGKYDGKKIEYGYGTDYLTAVQNTADYYQQYYQQQGQQLSQADYLYIFMDAFDSVVMDMMYQEYVDASGYIPSENAIKREMVQYFLDDDGNYSAKKFREATDSYKKELMESLSKSDIANRFQKDNLGYDLYRITDRMYGLKYSEAETDFYSDLRRTSRDFQMVSFDTTTYPDSQVAQYAENNKDLFKQYSMTAITASSEATLKSIQDTITNNEVTFDDAAANLSSRSYCDDSGKLTSSYAYQLKNILTSDSDYTAVTSLKVGETSGIIAIKNGYAIFRSDAAPVAADIADESVKTIVSNYIYQNEQGIIDDYFTGLASDFAANAAKTSFEEAAAAEGLTVKTLSGVSINYNNHYLLPISDYSSYTELSNAQKNETFMKTAFALKQNEISSPFKNGNNMIVLKMTNEDVVENEMDLGSMVYYYLSSYTQSDFSTSLLNSDKIENNVFSVWLENFYN